MNIFDELGVKKEADAVLGGCRKVRRHLLPVSMNLSAMLIRTEWLDSPRVYDRMAESFFLSIGQQATDIRELIAWHDSLNALKRGEGKEASIILAETLAALTDFCRAVRRKLAI